MNNYQLQKFLQYLNSEIINQMNSINRKEILISLVSIFLFSGVFAKESPKDSIINQNKPVRVYNTTHLRTAKPTIGGVLNDPCREPGEWAGDYTQWIPKEGAKRSQPTQMKILCDDKNIYVALRAFDNEPGKISRKAGRRDELFGDRMGVTFDSYHDHRTGFEFIVTASGQKVDDIITNPMVTDMNWNEVWYVKTGLEDSAWVAEFEIPLSQLRYSGNQEQV